MLSLNAPKISSAQVGIAMSTSDSDQDRNRGINKGNISVFLDILRIYVHAI